MTNNDIFKKLRVALMFRDKDIIEVLKLVDFKIEKSELNALFRNEEHPNYVECGDQILRNFLNGLIIHLRGSKENPKFPGDVLAKSNAAKSATSQASEKPLANKKSSFKYKSDSKYRSGSGNTSGSRNPLDSRNSSGSQSATEGRRKLKSGTTKRPSFKEQQLKNSHNDISNVPYKNKPGQGAKRKKT